MKKHWQDWGNLVLGLWILASPWLLQITPENPLVTLNLYLVGAAVAALAAIAILAFQAWEEWTNVALGAWLFVSPWALGFSTSTVLMWNAVIAGALIVVLAGMAISPPQDSASHA